MAIPRVLSRKVLEKNGESEASIPVYQRAGRSWLLKKDLFFVASEGKGAWQE
jgi:hypothetical protein